MKENMFKFEKNDYYWDKEKKCLISFQPDCVNVEQFSTKLGNASAIDLDEDILDSLGFKSNGKGEYENGEYVITIDATKPDGILWFDGAPVKYVSDIQQICRKKGVELYIDESKLRKACLMRDMHRK